MHRFGSAANSVGEGGTEYRRGVHSGSLSRPDILVQRNSAPTRDNSNRPACSERDIVPPKIYRTSMSEPAPSPPRNTGGGAATASGIDFQNRVAAWLAVRILAEEESQPLWNWDARSTLSFIRCETEQPVDDILVGNSDGGFGFLQVKHKLSVTKGAGSTLASAIGQFVRQFQRPAISAVAPSRPWDRSFDSTRDKLVLAIGRESSASATIHLPAVLSKVREASADRPFAPAQLNEEQSAILATLRSHVEASWNAVYKKPASDDDVYRLLRVVYVELIDADRDGVAEREAKELLRRTVLHRPENADLAWAKLLEICAGYAKSHGGGARLQIQEQLSAANLALNSPASYREDIAKLKAYSAETIESLSRLAEIRIGATVTVKIIRRSTKDLEAAATAGSLLVIGEPGAGKSGALYDLAGGLLKQGAEVLFFATDRIQSSSLATLKSELQLEHPLIDVLKNWGGAGPVYFITDALDAARSDHAGAMFRETIGSALGLGNRCRIVASIRMFDLRHDTRLKGLFVGEPHATFRDPGFASIRHFLVPILDDEELRQLSSQSADLGRLVQAVLLGDNPDMRRLISVPFNLRLLGELIGEGTTVASLTPIRTQLELLDRYWAERVIRNDGLSDARETVLRAVATSMFQTRHLHAPRAAATAIPAASLVLDDLLSADILQEYSSGSIDGYGRNTLKFPHHLLFDYALSRLLFRVDHESLAKIIADDPDCGASGRRSETDRFPRHQGRPDRSAGSQMAAVGQ